MVNWIVKDFKQEHADEIISYGMNSKLMELDAAYKDNRVCLADEGNAYTLFVDKKPIVAGGIVVIWNGVAEGWVMASQNIYDIKFLAANFVRSLPKVGITRSRASIMVTSQPRAV